MRLAILQPAKFRDYVSALHKRITRAEATGSQASAMAAVAEALLLCAYVEYSATHTPPDGHEDYH